MRLLQANRPYHDPDPPPWPTAETASAWWLCCPPTLGLIGCIAKQARPSSMLTVKDVCSPAGTCLHPPTGWVTPPGCLQTHEAAGWQPSGLSHQQRSHRQMPAGRAAAGRTQHVKHSGGPQLLSAGFWSQQWKTAFAAHVQNPTLLVDSCRSVQ